jgi:hypothetical protein
VIQAQLAERFTLPMSISQLNRVRAMDGASVIRPNLRKKVSCFPREQGWQEGAGGLLLLVADHETALLSQLEAAVLASQDSSKVPQPSAQRLSQPQRNLLLTLVSLKAIGLHRPWDLHTYTRVSAILT